MFAELPGLGQKFKVVGLYDPRPEAIAHYQNTFAAGATPHPTPQSLVNDPAVDWVMIGSFNCFHREHAIAALRAGKHVFCEKPLATTMKDLKAIRQARLAASDRHFKLSFPLRYSTFYRKVKELITRGRIGRIISMEFNETLDFNHGGYIAADWRRKRELAGPHLLEKCCHDLDLVHWLTGSLPRRVASFGGLDFFLPKNQKHQRRVGKHPENGHRAYEAMCGPQPVNPFTEDKDIVDNQVAILEYYNGVRATFHTNLNAAIPERRLYILGETGAIRADLGRGCVEYRPISHTKPIEEFPIDFSDGHAGGDVLMLRDLANTMLKGKPMPTGFDDGLWSAVAALGIDRAMTSGRTVTLDRMWQQVGLEPMALEANTKLKGKQ